MILSSSSNKVLARSVMKEMKLHRKRPETAIIKLMGGRNKTKPKQNVPISPERWAVSDEIEAEQRKVTSLQAANLVFTKDGQPINRHQLRKGIRARKEESRLERLPLPRSQALCGHPLGLAGIPDEFRKIAAGHSRGSVHQRYINPPDQEMVRVFAERLGWENGNKVETKRVAEQGGVW